MAPQAPQFNRNIWRRLESAVRKLATTYIEVYAICGPLFDIRKPFTKIGDDVVVPHEFFKSVLAEDERGKLRLWSFVIPNEGKRAPLETFLVPTVEVEFRAGLLLWDRLRGETFEHQKSTKSEMWET